MKNIMLYSIGASIVSLIVFLFMAYLAHHISVFFMSTWGWGKETSNFVALSMTLMSVIAGVFVAINKSNEK